MLNDCDTLLLSNGPWLFTYICSSWRTLVLGTPELWSSICYYDDWEGRTGTASLLDSARSNADVTSLKKSRSLVGAGHLVSLALDRSAGLPVSFKFQTSDIQLLYHPVLFALRMHSARWVDVYLECGVPLLSSLADVHVLLPSLKVLNIWICDEAQQPEHCASQRLVCPSSAFANAPELATLALSGFPGAPASIQLPWEQIRIYKTTLATAFEARAVLSRIRNVEHCNLYLQSDVCDPVAASDDEDIDANSDDEDMDDHSEDSDMLSIDIGNGNTFSSDVPLPVLPRLQTLIFHTSFLDYIDASPESILNDLTLPSLTSVTICSYHRAGVADRLVALIHRSGANLTKLIFITCASFTDKDCEHLLRATPCLLELGIVDINSEFAVSHHFLIPLTMSLGSPALAPSLKTILISGSLEAPHEQAPPKSQTRFGPSCQQPCPLLYNRGLLDMIESRFNSRVISRGGGLEHVELGFHHDCPFDEDARRRFQLLQSAGLSILLRNPWSSEIYLDQ